VATQLVDALEEERWDPDLGLAVRELRARKRSRAACWRPTLSKTSGASASALPSGS
jgi:hypothetical protein